MLAALTAFAITSVARLITGARALWLGCTPQPVQRLYYANHSSHGDFVLIWASLPQPLRQHSDAISNPLQPIQETLAQGDSLIFFPEGTRNLSDEPLLAFKSGLFHLASAHPQVEVIPVWIANLNRVMPKGRALPLPLLCTLSFGEPLHLQADESKHAFLDRARQALLALAPKES